jgi:PAS domain S-box-containing protein
MSDSDVRLFKLLRMYCETSAIVAVGVGCLVLYGWAFHIELLKSVLPGLVAMKANTALGLAFSGTSLWLLLPGDSRTPRNHIARFLAFLVTVIGAATLSEYLFGLNLRIDELLFNESTGTVATYSPGRMAPTTSTAFLAIGLALLLLDWKTRRGHRPAQVLSLWAAFVAMMAITGYIYHATALYRILLYTQVALHTAIALFLLSVAIFFARPQTGIASELTSEASGSVMARRFLPAVFCVPILLGWIRLQGQFAGLYGTELGLALYATANIIVFAVLVWLSARQMNKEYHQRARVEVEIRELNAELEGRVTERTKALEQQAAILTEQAALLDLAQDAIIVMDMHSRILLWNRGAEAMYGWPSRKALGRNTHELLKTEFSEPTEKIEAKLLRQGQWEGESIHHKRDGTRLTVASRWALQRDADGAPARILTINNDITQRKQAESDLRLLSERLSLATAVARVGVWEWNLASNMVTCDKTMHEIYGFSPTVAVPDEKWSVPTPYDKFAAAIHPEDLPEVEATLQRAIAEKGQGSAEFRIILADGSIRNISAVEAVVLDARANVSCLIGVNMDITDRKQAEETLEQGRKDQLRFKDEFLSHVSHELRSPLTAIKQFTTILLGGLAGELNKEQIEYQQIVLKNIRQLQSMIDDLLEVTRLETGKLSVEPESVSVSDAAADTLNTLQGTARHKGITLSCDLPADLPSVYADQTRLRQILIILLDNAIKFTADGGAVKIQARLLEQDPQFLLLEVSDTGCGIGPEIAERIFERLYQVSEPNQASRKGLGLGLYICKELVTRHGGQIWVKSQPQKGSTFSFTLPVFSLNNLISPLLKNDKWPAESVALVMLEICLLDAWPSKESQKKWSHEVRSLVQRCLLPNLDVLLPKMSYGAEGERFFVAAFADEKGASVLADRIREQFERLPDLKQTGLTLSVSYSMLKPFLPDAGASMENIVTSMATNLEESIKSQTISEAIYHE